MIPPTIGRVVLVCKDGNDQWCPAQICFVHQDGRINVAGFDNNGFQFRMQGITLHQNDIAKDPVLPPNDALTGRIPTPFACWMPYQRAG